MRVLFFIFTFSIMSCTLRPFSVPLATENNKAVVFDIDGTLTPDLLSIYTARENAANAVQQYANNGYTIVYLSARFRWLQSGIPQWLEDNDFPAGSIHVPQSFSERRNAESFKTRILHTYLSKGWQFYAAYGDSSTDFSAYNNADISASRIFATKRNDEDFCQPGIWAACLPSWSSHLTKIRQILNPPL